MCGITALSRSADSSIRGNGRTALINGLLAIEHRGYHSTGAAWTRGKGKRVWYAKTPGPASKVAAHLDLDRRLRIHAAIGHTRWATHGAHTYENAHPVTAGHITLVHNGIVSNHDELIELSGMAADRIGEVDSWAIAAILAATDNEGTHPTTALELVRGDAAVAWFSSDDPATMHLARLIGRPLTLGWTKGNDLLMSSTPETLRAWATMTRQTLHDVTNVPEGTYLSVRQGAITEWRSFAAGGRKPSASVRPDARRKRPDVRTVEATGEGRRVRPLGIDGTWARRRTLTDVFDGTTWDEMPEADKELARWLAGEDLSSS